MDVQDNVPHIQAKFKSTNQRYAINAVCNVHRTFVIYHSFDVPNHPFSIPQSLDYEELNKLANGIIGRYFIY